MPESVNALFLCVSLAALSAHTSVRAPCVANIHRWAGCLVRSCAIDKSLLDVGRERVKCLIDVDVTLCGDFEERNAEFVGEGLATLCADGALLLPIALVSDEDLIDAFGCVLLDVGEPGADVCCIVSAFFARMPLQAVQLAASGAAVRVTYC